MEYGKLRLRWQRERQARAQQAVEIRQVIAAKGPAVFEQFGIRRVVLFGSVQTGRCTGRSDIDLLVAPLETQRYWECLHALEDALERPIDLHTPDEDPLFVAKVFERGEVIYET